jgi:hypothetical protein
LTDDPRLKIGAELVEQKADSLSIEQIHELVTEMQQFTETQREPSAKATGTAPTEPPPASTGITDTVVGRATNALAIAKEPRERFGKALETLASMIKQLNDNVSRISTRKFPTSEQSSPETTKTVAKISSIIRRLSYHLKKLENLLAEESKTEA